MPMLNIFDSDAFSAVTLTQAIEKVPFKPQLLGQLAIFETVPIRTEKVAVEKREGRLSIIQTSQRGAPRGQRSTEKRDIRDFRTARITEEDTITASELQNMRAMGSETELQTVQAEIMRRYAGPTGIQSDIEMTWENMRLGAIQGIVKDADGSTIYNWFDEWDITAASAINFALGTAATNIRGKCNQVGRAMAKASKGAWIPGRTKVHALCGSDFYDALVDHPKVRDTYLNWAAAADLREAVGGAYSAFNFGDIVWHDYRGSDDFISVASAGTGGMGVTASEAKFFPVGAPGVFQVAYSPGEAFDFVNTPGMPVYARIIPDRDRNEWAKVEVDSYPLFMCTRPEMLQKATAS